MASSALFGQARKRFLASASRARIPINSRVVKSSAIKRSFATNGIRSLTSKINGYEQTIDDSYLNWIKMAAGITAAGAVTASGILDTSNKAECCGIAGVIGTADNDARAFLLEGLTVLKNRGYDSAGVATLSPSQTMTISKYASDGDNADGIDLVRKHSLTSSGHSIGIAHTRWATHGGKTDENAHPHTDSSGKIAIVHNGTINNANEMRKELKGLGHKFTSQTDTEVIAKLIGHIRDEAKGEISVMKATELALDRCDGTWGLCVMSADDPDQLIVACNGSPLVIGVAQDRTFIASETSAFNRYTKSFIPMKDGEIGVLHADGRTLDLTRTQKAPDQKVELSPAPFPHWTLKELTEQPEAIARSLGFGGRLSTDRVYLGGLDNNEELMSKIKFMTLSACGTSLNAAKYAEKIMKNLEAFDHVASLDAAETSAKDFPKTSDPKNTGLIVVSQSGETKDVHRVVKTAMKEDITVLSVVNAVGSLIARTTQLGVYCNAGRENAVASTKAFTTQITVLALIALWFRQMKDRKEGAGPSYETKVLAEALTRLPISFGMTMKNCREKCKKVAERLNSSEHCFVLGKGYGEPVAYEGALKIKEMCYLHAEGYSGGALKHGPFALIEDNKNGKFGATPIILLIFDDEHANHMRTCAEEVKARGADLIIITDNEDLAEGLSDNPIVIPSNGPLTALGAVLPLQLIAYDLAMLRGINPDTPRNLAKAVTVD